MKSSKIQSVLLTALFACHLSILTASAQARQPEKFDLSICGSNFIHFPADSAIKMVEQVGIHNLCVKEKHLPFRSNDSIVKDYKRKLAEAGITPVSTGLFYLHKEKEADRVFDYAHRLGVSLIIATPDYELLPYIEKKVMETNIRLAIHTHGPDLKQYPNADDVMAHIANLDKRIGLCLDIGHDARVGADPIADLRKYHDRIFDIHIKDITAADKSGRTCEMGRGVLDLTGFIKALRETGYDGYCSFEHEKDLIAGPIVGIAESVGYFKALLRATAPMDDYFDQAFIKAKMEKVIDWQLEHKKRRVKNEWTHGVLFAGMMAAWQSIGSQKAYDAVKAVGKEVGWKPRDRWYHADDYVIGQAFMDMYAKEHNPQMMIPTKTTIDKFIAMTDDKHGKMRWNWCDALFMGPPVLTKIGKTMHIPVYHKYCYKYFKECYDLLYDKEQHLFFRDSTFLIKGMPTDKYEANGEPVFWLRGNGWVVAGLTRILQDLPRKNKHRAFYENLFKEMVSRLAEIQPADGMWCPGLLNQTAYPHGETSGTALICYAMAWGINQGLLDAATYAPVVRRSWEALCRVTDDNGRVGWVQQIGFDPRSNFTAFSWELYGTGAFLLAASEVYQMSNN